MISLGRISAAVVLSLLLVACNHSELPKLEKGEALRADCAILMGKFSEGEIPQDAWPRSVKDLKPTRVVREQNAVRIFVQEKNFHTGYYVSPNLQAAPSTQGVWIRKTEFKGIYQFRHY